jgi:hypothetical protein
MPAVKWVNHEAEPFSRFCKCTCWVTLYVFLWWGEIIFLWLRPVGSNVCPTDDRRLNMKHLCVDNWHKNTKVLEGQNLSMCYCVLHKSHLNYAVIENRDSAVCRRWITARVTGSARVALTCRGIFAYLHAILLFNKEKHFHESVEITNKMQPRNRIYHSKVYWRLKMFRAAHRSSSGALNSICCLWFIYTCGDRPLSRLSGTTAGHHMGTRVYKPVAANTYNIE